MRGGHHPYLLDVTDGDLRIIHVQALREALDALEPPWPWRSGVALSPEPGATSDARSPSPARARTSP
jgi:hypothetical protein